MAARAFFTALHRWAGLTTALFLFTSGMTGAIISWDHELDEMLNPHIYTGSAGLFVDRIVRNARNEGERNSRSSPTPLSDKRG